MASLNYKIWEPPAEVVVDVYETNHLVIRNLLNTILRPIKVVRLRLNEETDLQNLAAEFFPMNLTRLEIYFSPKDSLNPPDREINAKLDTRLGKTHLYFLMSYDWDMIAEFKTNQGWKFSS